MGVKCWRSAIPQTYVWNSYEANQPPEALKADTMTKLSRSVPNSPFKDALQAVRNSHPILHYI